MYAIFLENIRQTSSFLDARAASRLRHFLFFYFLFLTGSVTQYFSSLVFMLMLYVPIVLYVVCCVALWCAS
jgi:hypothetical protein